MKSIKTNTMSLIGELKGVCHIKTDKLASNAIANMKRGLPVLKSPIASHNGHCAILGGGHSLKENISHAFSLPCKKVAIGSTHDYIIDQGYIPDIYVCIEAATNACEFIKKPHKDIKYYISSCTDSSTLDALKGYDVTLFHIYELDGINQDMIINGGSTVGSRACFLINTLGYSFFHLFGLDSSFKGDKVHCYDTNNPNYKFIDVIANNRVFKTLPQWLTQVKDFQDIIKFHNDIMKFIVYGDGLLQHALKGN